MTDTTSPLHTILANWQRLPVYIDHAGNGPQVQIGWLVDCDASAAAAMSEWANVVQTGDEEAYFVSPMAD